MINKRAIRNEFCEVDVNKNTRKVQKDQQIKMTSCICFE